MHDGKRVKWKSYLCIVCCWGQIRSPQKSTRTELHLQSSPCCPHLCTCPPFCSCSKSCNTGIDNIGLKCKVDQQHYWTIDWFHYRNIELHIWWTKSNHYVAILEMTGIWIQKQKKRVHKHFSSRLLFFTATSDIMNLFLKTS